LERRAPSRPGLIIDSRRCGVGVPAGMAKHDESNKPRKIAVQQIATLVPAEKIKGFFRI